MYLLTLYTSRVPLATSRAETLRDRYRRRLPNRLDELDGPAHGTVDLPLHVVWSGRTNYTLDRPKSCMTPVAEQAAHVRDSKDLVRPAFAVGREGRGEFVRFAAGA